MKWINKNKLIFQSDCKNTQLCRNKYIKVEINWNNWLKIIKE